MSEPISINQLRIFNIASQELMPLIRELHGEAYTMLMAKFRNGEKDLVAQVARCEAFESIIEEIEAKSLLYEQQVNKLNKERSNEENH